ncbi:glycoside hydrolase family 15 protein [Dermatobacter hominis]|uniref:glycoside hydrolase family 15 protein n=1 Tax=Dermatobacter hominis TaxID=2884263 RepID=UPI001D1137B1|nr:glycoside hydrolase family 15 protein [Dermatobacter hominis]UDY34329.1 glycoside hydrolase family 15 protein [Dermatobacter hominis]
MPSPASGSLIEDHALIGDTRGVALVDRTGSIDWWCPARIDAPACFAALLGTPDHGHWRLAPTEPVLHVERRYEPDTLVLETVMTTASGTVAVIDFMTPEHADPTIHRRVEGRDGSVRMEMELVVRFDYGSVTPWVRATGDGLLMVGGSEALRLNSPVPLHGRDMRTYADFSVDRGEHRSFSLAWHPSVDPAPLPLDTAAALHGTRGWWRAWVSRCTYTGPWREDVIRSLITLKALTNSRTGAVAAAATTSLPEWIGGVRNWDYRYSWLRDATFTLQAFLVTGFHDEAAAWSRWLRRAVAGSPGDFQILYGVGGERRLPELVLDWLPGYEGSAPVRIGNAASGQFQLDVFGEVMDAAATARRAGMQPRDAAGVDIFRALMAHLEAVWQEPDEGIWEVRGPRRHFTHSKVMAWVAFDRAVRMATSVRAGDPIIGSVDEQRVARWAELRDEVHAQVCERGWNDDVGAFTQFYGSDRLDASLLMMMAVGFLPPDDHRMVATIEAIRERLSTDGFVRRYETEPPGPDGTTVDGLPPGEGAFLLTTFWLADALAMMGRVDEATEVFERLRGLRNDVGLLSEEWDPAAGRMLGNFPQAFSHVGLVNTAANIAAADGRGPGMSRAGVDRPA